MSKTLITFLLGSALGMLPFSSAAGNESALGKTSPNAGSITLPLPAVPHLDTIDWLNSRSDFSRRPNVLGPKLDTLSPFLIDPKTTPRQFSSGGKGFDSTFE